MCFVSIWEQTATCTTYSINWLVFITEMKSVYCAVQTGSLNKAACTSSLKGYLKPQHLQWHVKCTLVQALRLCTGWTAHRGSRGIALPFHDHSTRRGWGVSIMPRPLFTPRKDPLYRRLGGPQGRSGQVQKMSPPTRIQSPDRPAHCQSLYRLHYPVHYNGMNFMKLEYSYFIQHETTNLY